MYKTEKLGMQIAYRRLGLSCFVTHVRSIAVKGKLSKEMWYDKNERVISWHHKINSFHRYENEKA